jgi:hypothetical protein
LGQFPLTESVKFTHHIHAKSSVVSTSLLSHAALKAADSRGKLREYLRKLRIAAMVEGRDIEDPDALTEIAADIGLELSDVDWKSAQNREAQESESPPLISAKVGVRDVQWSGGVEYHFLLSTLKGEGIKPQPVTKSAAEFAADNCPVSTPEIESVYDIAEVGSRVRKVRIGDADFWCPK